MAIDRLSFPEYLNMQAGIELSTTREVNAQLGVFVRRFGNYARRLKEGTYDITPPIWEKNIYQHTLTVLDSGNGIVRLIPRFPDSQSGNLDDIGRVDYRRGGRIIRIPEDHPIFALAGPNRLSSKVCLYELIFHLP